MLSGCMRVFIRTKLFFLMDMKLKKRKITETNRPGQNLFLTRSICFVPFNLLEVEVSVVYNIGLFEEIIQET